MKDSNDRIIKKSLIISIIVFLGKILGFIKQSVIAWAFGANIETDIFFSADSYISVFGQIQLSSIAPGVLTEYVKTREKKDREDIDCLVSSIYIFFTLLAIILVIINIDLSRDVSVLLGISYSADQKIILNKYIIMLCPVIIFSSLIGIAQGILDANHRFVPTKLLSLFFSFSIIVFIIMFRKQFGIKSMLYGFLVGYGIHAVYVTIYSKKYYTFKIVNFLQNKNFKNVLKHIIPLIIGNSIVDLGHLVDKVIASSLNEGSVSYLYYGQIVSSDLVNAVVITSFGTVLLPEFTKIIACGVTNETLIKKINEVINTIILIIAIINALYFVEGKDLIQFFFERGSFTANSTLQVSYVALCYVLGFLFIAFREVFVKVHYAFGDTVTPMMNGIIGIITNTILSILLSKLYGVIGIALATSISVLLVACLMGHSLSRHLGTSIIDLDNLKEILKSIVVMMIITILGYFIRLLLISISNVLRLIIVSVIMIILYVCLLGFLRHNIVRKIIYKYMLNDKK